MRKEAKRGAVTAAAGESKKPKKANHGSGRRRKDKSPTTQNAGAGQPSASVGQGAQAVQPDDPRIPKSGPRTEDMKIAEVVLKDQETTENFAKATEGKAGRFKKALGPVWDDLCTMIRLVKAYASKVYLEIPYRSILMIVAALVYLLSPFDLIPDFIPIIGMIDDMAVLAWTAKAIHSDLEDFREWERTRKVGSAAGEA